MGIVKAGPFGEMICTDQLQLLDVDHNAKPSDWNMKPIDYANDRMVVHVWPNKGAHSSGMTTIDHLDLSTCECYTEYDTTDEGELMVIHNAEPEIGTG